MKFTSKLLLLAALLLTISFASAQKIGYANVEMILAYMPESKAMNQQIQTYRKQLAEKLQTREKYMQEKYAEYQEKGAEMIQAGKTETEAIAALEPLAKEIEKLEGEVQQAQQDSEEKLARKQQELQAPILEKLKKAIDEVAAEKAYTYVFNSVDGSGVSILIKAPLEDDLTEVILKKLGIEIPKEPEAAPATPAAGGTPAPTAPKTGGQ